MRVFVAVVVAALLASIVMIIVGPGGKGQSAAPAADLLTASGQKLDGGWIVARSGSLLRLSNCTAQQLASYHSGNGSSVSCEAGAVPLTAIANACPAIGQTMQSEAIAPNTYSNGFDTDGGWIDVLCKEVKH